jgi:pyridoxine kinase
MTKQLPPTILAIHSAVVYGHVGNSAAVFPLQRLGFEVWPINTLQFSNHPGYGDFGGRVFPANHIAELIEGLGERGVLGQCDAILSGYLGDPGTADAVVDAVERIRTANPSALYCCDPIMGDCGQLYVRPGLPEFFAGRALARANIVTPNHFEFGLLVGGAPSTLSGAIRAGMDLLRKGPSIVLITSLEREGAPHDCVEMLAITHGAAFLIATPRLDLSPNGAGDAMAAIFLGRYLTTRSVEIALSDAASAIFAILQATATAGTRELQLITAQDALLAPPQRLVAWRIS